MEDLPIDERTRLVSERQQGGVAVLSFKPFPPKHRFFAHASSADTISLRRTHSLSPLEMTIGIRNTAKAASFWLLAFWSFHVVIAFHPGATRSPAWTHLKSRPQCPSIGFQNGMGSLASHGGDSLGLDGSSQISSADLLVAKATTATLPEVPSIPENTLPSTSDSSNHMREVVQKVVDSWQQGYQETVGSIHNPPRSPGSAPTLAQYIREGRFHPEDTINRLRNLKGLNVENFVQELRRVQQSVLHGIDAEGKGMEKVSQLLQKIPVEKMARSIQNFVLALQTPSEDTVQNSLKALDLDELGGWYVGSLGVLWFISQSTISLSSRKNLEQKLNEATEVIDKEAKVAEQKVQSLLTEKERMENQVKELSKATVTVSEELKELKLEKASRDYAVAEMKSELRSLKNELKSRQLKEKEVASQLTKAENKLKAETLKLQRELEERRAKEAALQERIMELQAQLGTNSGASSLEEPKVATKSSKTTKSRKSSTVREENCVGCIVCFHSTPLTYACGRKSKRQML